MSRIFFAPLPHDRYSMLGHALEAVSLPADDIEKEGCVFFALADVEGPIGFVGLEGVGPDRLLRSLVVLPHRKRQGHGALLLAHIEVVARGDRAERLHLLTTTASGFFRARGYVDAERGTAPSSIAGTAQFDSLCPESAAYLVKEIL